MDIDTVLIDYFDFNIDTTIDPVKIKIRLKDSKKCRIDNPIRPESNIPYSGVQLEYYLHFLDNPDIAKQVWTARKSVCSKIRLLDWCLNNLNLDSNTEFILRRCGDNIRTNISKGSKRHYDSPAGDITRKKLCDKQKKWAKIIGKQNSERWKDPEYKSKQMSIRLESDHYKRVVESNRKWMSDPNNKSKFIDACNKPERVAKIRKAITDRWNHWIEFNPEIVRKVIYSGRNKQYQINGIHMNRIEFEVCNFLNSIGVTWEYEKIFTHDKRTYVPDFYLPEYNIVIECYGDYWHANPDIFVDTSLVYRTPVAEIRARDNRRKLFFEALNIQFISLWETDILKNFENIKQQLCELLKKK